ncbi:MAG: alpha/beta hydrolase [Clostridia bacterium]|nr:alpha/beta hydrolase [Clostridia bacterium]
MAKTETFEFNGYTATVITPDNPNGKWVWKTEFLYAFDQAEQALLERGYTRVYYCVSDKYGSYNAVRLMHAFHKHLVKNYPLCEKPVLFGFSRGGLYAFNYALFYPEYVEKVYLDAPVLDMKTWPPKGSGEYAQMLEEYGLNDEAFLGWKGNPIDNLPEYFSLGIPTLVVAGGADEVVPFPQNSGKLIDFCKKQGIALEYYVKPECMHHPHSLEDVTPIVAFVEKE